MARAEAMLQAEEPLYYTTDMEFSVKGIQLESQSRPTPVRVEPLHELFYRSPEMDVASLPARLIIYDWSASNDPSSGKRGTYALQVLRQHGRAIPLLMSEHGWPEPLLYEIRDIDWAAVQATAARHLAPWSEWKHLPWILRRDAGGGELVERIGYAAPDMAPEGLFRWLVGGYSEFYLHRADLGSELPQGDYLFIVALERHPATALRPMELTITITNGQRQVLDLPQGSHVFALPFRIDSDSPRGIMRIEFHYDTWIPAESGVGGDTRPLGPRLQWYGILPAATVDIPPARRPIAH
jgi:hypothetical protein